MPLMKQKQTARTFRSQKHWYVMLHFEPEEIERKLQQENAQRGQRGSMLLEYFVPYTFLPRAVPDKYAKDAEQQASDARQANSLRQALRRFLFIRAGSREIVSLVHRDWNRESRLHLFFYNTRSGEHITMPDEKMRQFITLCCESLQRFDFGPPITDIDSCDTVVIKNGPLKDAEAKVIGVQHTASGVSLTLGLPFFCGEKTLVLENTSLDDVHLPRTVESLLNDRFIDNVENALLTVLHHRLRPSAPPVGEEPEEQLLNRIFHYSYVRMPDLPSYLRFRALMLVCATLRLDVESRRHIATELSSQLEGNPSVTAADQAFIQAALYVATGAAACRSAAKAYWQAHREDGGPVCRIMPIVTRLDRRFFRLHKVDVRPSPK